MQIGLFTGVREAMHFGVSGTDIDSITRNRRRSFDRSVGSIIPAVTFDESRSLEKLVDGSIFTAHVGRIEVVGGISRNPTTRQESPIDESVFLRDSVCTHVKSTNDQILHSGRYSGGNGEIALDHVVAGAVLIVNTVNTTSLHDEQLVRLAGTQFFRIDVD